MAGVTKRWATKIHHCFSGVNDAQVALTQDHPEAGLKRGDVGAVVELLGQNTYEVEFVTASGHTQALISLSESQVRALGDRDLISVRTLAEFEA